MPSAVVIGKDLKKCRWQADCVQACLSRRAEPWQVDIYPACHALHAFFDIALVNTDNGLEDARLLREKDRRVAILLASDETGYASEGYDLSASAYLLQPITPEQIGDALAAGLRRLQRHWSYIDLPARSGVLREQLDNILYIEQENAACRVYAFDRSYPLTVALDALNLPGYIFLCDNRRINLSHVRQITDSGLWIDNLFLPVSPGARRRLMKALPIVRP